MNHRQAPIPLTMAMFSLVLFFGPDGASAAPPQQTDLFVSGAEGYHTFRIPALIVTKKGTLLAFCEGRKTSSADHGDIDLVLKRSSDGGQTWGPLQIVHEEGGTAKITIGNPCPVVDEGTGTIWLPFCRDNREVFVTHSRDDGRTWAQPVEITRDLKKPDWVWYATGPGVGLQLRHGPHKGRLLIPCDHSAKVDGKLAQHAHVIFSDDHGQTWKLGGTVAPYTDECQVVELNGGRLLINMRNYWGRAGQPEKGNRRALAWSKDGGLTWSDLQFDATLIEPVCQASLLRHSWPAGQDPGRLLFANPASSTKRAKLTIRLSTDNGKTWPTARVLHEGPAAYSCLAVLPDGTICCLYERGQKRAYETLTFARFSLKWLAEE